MQIYEAQECKYKIMDIMVCLYSFFLIIIAGCSKDLSYFNYKTVIISIYVFDFLLHYSGIV